MISNSPDSILDLKENFILSFASPEKVILAELVAASLNFCVILLMILVD
ncbi:MAG: hypothetical protein IJE43_03295 [Alphaproteobacteria bacterium]|nr:hypothetical protein [Alphaproteobacteria bacterium]